MRRNGLLAENGLSGAGNREEKMNSKGNGKGMQQSMETITPIEVSSFNDLVSETNNPRPLKQKWVFRGQTGNWPLTTSLERLCSSLHISQRDHGLEIEEILQREFQRRFYHYATHVPEPNDNLEWLATMQHYGAATRLLDWSYSPYVALYFALERTAEKDDHSVVWAVDLRWLQRKAMQLVAKHPQYGKKTRKVKTAIQHFMLESPAAEEKKIASNWLYQLNHPCKFVFPATPFNLNTRLTVQKGLFICPADPTETFVSNLEGMPGIYSGYGHAVRAGSQKNILKFHICRDKRRGFLRSLQSMNVSADSLFPGLDGFARSLAVYHHRFDELPEITA